MADTLARQAQKLACIPVRDLFARDPERFARCAREMDNVLFDFSRQRIDEDALGGLLERARRAGLLASIKGLFEGEAVNATENRPALHTLLRTPAESPLPHALVALHAHVLAVRAQCAAFVADLHEGRRAGSTGERFTDIVNIGIGGSDLGPAMAVAALQPFHTGHVRCHFVSNVDATQFSDLAAELDPARTLFIVCSKTFTTQETIANARRARAWVAERLGEAAVPKHFAAVSTNAVGMDEFGVGAGARFTIWDWVGGRYSLWSAVGLSVELAIGTPQFEQLLGGAHAMDEHFRNATWRDNLPVLLGLIAVWNRDLLGCASHAVLPYSARLGHFPAYLQQLEMESLGKGVRRDGQPVIAQTGPVVWGAPGSNAQHSFFQLLHQGTNNVSVDLLLPLAGAADTATDNLVIANCLAQAQALMAGNDVKEPHRQLPGSRPVSLLAFPRLDPATLGRLVALYEHKVFVESVLWDLNPFDQWGVELGKEICSQLLAAREDAIPQELKPLLVWIAKHR
ncbi:MAG: glucose-6-phosphate isomerase [Steroidobacteraceae bacterium]